MDTSELRGSLSAFEVVSVTFFFFFFSFSHFYGAFLLGFFWQIILIRQIQSPYLVYLRILPCVRVHLSAKMESTEEAYG